MIRSTICFILILSKRLMVLLVSPRERKLMRDQRRLKALVASLLNEENSLMTKKRVSSDYINLLDRAVSIRETYTRTTDVSQEDTLMFLLRGVIMRCKLMTDNLQRKEEYVRKTGL